MNTVFLEDEMETFFKENGYLKLKFDNVQQIEECKKKIYNLQPSDRFQAYQKSMIHELDFHCTFFDSNAEYRKQVFDIITSLFAPIANKLLVDYKFIQANVFIKPPFKGYVAPHQNLTVVDEVKYTSLSFWCPAQDTTEANGTIVLVPKSHKKFMKYRTTNISWPLLPLFRDYSSPFLKSVSVKKGEFLILDDSIIHGTTINTSAAPRFVFHALLVPKKSEVMYCEINADINRVKLYRVPELFWQYYIPGSAPQNLPVIEDRKYDEREMTESEFKATLYDEKAI